MRKKELKLVITFHTTSEAIAMEKFCRENGVAGRLIPVPRQISAGCGLAWIMPTKFQEQIREWEQGRKITIDQIYECVV